MSEDRIRVKLELPADLAPKVSKVADLAEMTKEQVVSKVLENYAIYFFRDIGVTHRRAKNAAKGGRRHD